MQSVGVVLVLQKFFCNFRKTGKWGIEGIYPKCDGAGEARIFSHISPLPISQHGGLVAVGNDPAAFLADIGCELCTVRVGHASVFFRPLDLCKLQLDVLPAMGARNKIVFLHVRCFFGFPDVAASQGRGAAHVYFAVRDEGLGTFTGQADGVSFFLASRRVLVHLIEEQVADWL